MLTPLLFALFLSAVCVFAQRERVILDVDGSALNGFGVDDELALIYALAKQRIVGITATYGNTDLNSSVADVQLLLSLVQPSKKFEREIQVYPGADWSTRDLSRSTEAVEFFAKTLRKYPKDTITLLCLGPLTNLASFITLYPDLATRFRAVVLSAGREGSLELNLFAHPEATKLVLETPIPKLVTPPNAMTNLIFSPARIDSLEKKCCLGDSSNNRVVCELIPSMKHASYWHGKLFNRFLSNERPVQEGFYPYALIALLTFANASQFELSSEKHMEMILPGSFLEEPELRISSAPNGEFSRRQLFVNLVLEAGLALNPENVFWELSEGLCTPHLKPNVERGMFAKASSDPSIIFGLLTPAWHGVALFQNLAVVAILSVVFCLLLANLIWG